MAKNRKQRILNHIDSNGLGLEIGAGYSPLFPKQKGYKVKTLDHQSAEDLRLKYPDLSDSDLSKIEPVDFVWHGEPYTELVKGEKFDWIVASHVIEHVPDLIGFIKECASILKESGVLALAIPDKRYTFDYYRHPSSLAQIIDSHCIVGGVKKQPSVGDIMDYYFYSTEKSKLFSEATFRQNPTIDIYDKYKSAVPYTDVHVWVFTPHHFRLLTEDLFCLGVIPLREVAFSASKGEFFVFLSKKGAGPKQSRIKMAKKANRERQARFNLINVISRIDNDYCNGSVKKMVQKIIRN